MDAMKNFKKTWINSLSFLDNSIIHASIVIILIFYSSTIFSNINSFVGNLYNFSIVKLIVLVLIVYIAPKDTAIAVLLAVSYIVSLTYMVNNENFTTQEEEHAKKMKEPLRESFFPLTNLNTEQDSSSEYVMQNNTRDAKKMDTKASCLKSYTPQFESVGDVCSPTATFKNEFNAQGLNYPEGFNSPVTGSPL